MHNYKLWLASSKLAFTIIVLSIFFIPQVQAVVNIEGTRVVFNSTDNIVSLSLANSEKQPTLVQIWVDEGDIMASPETIKSPIIIAPPVFQMQPSEIRTVRLMLSSRSTLAKDRESLYWLNIYQIPPTPTSIKLDRKVILPLRIRMKIFIRPDGIRALEQQDGNQLSFKMTQQNGKTKLTISNPTFWHINLNKILVSDEKLQSVMLSPKSEYSVLLTKDINNYTQISYSVINDLGTSWQYNIKL